MCDVVCCGKGEMAMYGLVAAGSLQCMRWCVYAVNASVSSQQVSPSGRRRQSTDTTRDYNDTYAQETKTGLRATGPRRARTVGTL